jgi:hypothetical protein
VTPAAASLLPPLSAERSELANAADFAFPITLPASPDADD